MLRWVVRCIVQGGSAEEAAKCGRSSNEGGAVMVAHHNRLSNARC